MAKRKSRTLTLGGTPDSSKPGTPRDTDSDASDATPPRKKPKAEKKVSPAPLGPRSSEELCQIFGLVHVTLQYTDADYQNLTNYGLFVRMVRPQVQEANPTISSPKMAQLMEAKWREFREGNPLTKKRREEEEKRKEEEQKKKEEEDKKREEKKHKKEEKKKEKQMRKEAEESKPKSPVEAHVPDSEPEEDVEEEEDLEDLEDLEDEDEDEAEENGEEEVIVSEASEPDEPPRGRRSLPLMTVKLPLPKSVKKGKKPVAYISDEEVTIKKPKGKRSKSQKLQNSPVAYISDEEVTIKKSKARRSKSQKVQNSDEEAALSDDEDISHRKGRKIRKKKMTDYVDELSDDEDNNQPSAKKSKKAKVAEISDDDFERPNDSATDDDIDDEDEDEDMDDEDGDSDVEAPRKKKKQKKKQKKQSEKRSIPGERKSSRKSGAGNTSMSLLTDREFEKIIARDAELEKKKVVSKKKKLTETAKRKLHNDTKKKAYWEKQERIKNGEDAEDEEDEGNESDHCFYCEICHDAGDLLLCDKCPRSWHQACVKLEKIPEGEWLCPKCTGQMESEEEDTGHEAYCRVCRDGGDVLLCDYCPCVFHLECVTPPMTEIPEGDWKCPRCVTLDSPLKAKVHSIMTWKWTHHSKGFDELDHTHSPTKTATDKLRQEVQEAKAEQSQPGQQSSEPLQGKPTRMFYVRFRDCSYWECDWISELQLEMFHPITHGGFCRKWDMNEPPALEDGSSFGKRRRHNSTSETDDPYKLEERYYKWGVKPEWLQVDRIINHDKHKAYLVKWRELGYDEATWENAAQIPPGVEDWQKHVDKYWARRKEHLKEDKRDKGPKPKKSALKKQMEEQPDYVNVTGMKLHPYQLEGLNWLRFSWAQDTNTILADEMGLGKTIQAITFIYSLWKEGYTKGPFLLSVPLSTLLNWEREFALWAPELYVVTYIGNKESRPIIRQNEFCYKEGAFHQYAKPGKMKEGFRPKFDVLLTSYEFVSMDFATLSSIPWSVLIIDEAHRLKSQQSLFFRMLSQYKIDYILLLTGTPLQNNLEELFSLLNFLEREKFADMDTFLGSFTDISKDEQVSKLHEMLAPHMLRRLKIDVFKDLPSKTELIVRIELSPLQKKFYKNILTKNFEALNVKGHSNQTSLMNLMMDLRKCCNHPYLFPVAETEAPLTRNGLFEGNALIKACGKLEILNKMLKELKKQKHRVLLFSQMTRVLDILEDFLVSQNYVYERIDGSIMGKHRQSAIDRFNSENSDSFVFLLSTKAGGLGINLATADTVVIYDMDWNPHNDIQAFSRAHRIGQKNKVLIYRFVCRNTVEERMTQVCKQKMMLTELVIHRGMAQPNNKPGAEKAESITKKEVNDILKFGAEKLFKDDEEGKVVYDDETIKNLLDRDQDLDNKGDVEETPTGEAQSFGMNDYLRSFNVATYKVKDVAENEEEEEEEEKVEEPEKPEEDASYWSRVLGTAYNEHQLQLLRDQEELAATLGKGKRVRRKVNYAEAEKQQEQRKLAKEERRRQQELREQEHREHKERKERKEAQVIDEDEEEDEREDVLYLSDYEPASSEHSEDSSANEEETVVEPPLPILVVDTKKSTRRSRQKASEKEQPVEKEKENKIPALLAKCNGQIEVLGFTPRQRRAFMDAVMRYGLPLEDVVKSQWLVRDLRRKPEKVFRAFVSLFLRHLCEPITEDAEKFADGTPREGLSRQHVLTRIGMMSLIRRKVSEFEKNNGTDSFQDFGIQIVIGGSKAELALPKTGDKNKPDEKSIESDKGKAKEGAEDDKKVDIDEKQVKKDAEGKDSKKEDGEQKGANEVKKEEAKEASEEIKDEKKETSEVKEEVKKEEETKEQTSKAPKDEKQSEEDVKKLLEKSEKTEMEKDAGLGGSDKTDEEKNSKSDVKDDKTEVEQKPAKIVPETDVKTEGTPEAEKQAEVKTEPVEGQSVENEGSESKKQVSDSTSETEVKEEPMCVDQPDIKDGSQDQHPKSPSAQIQSEVDSKDDVGKKEKDEENKDKQEDSSNKMEDKQSEEVSNEVTKEVKENGSEEKADVKTEDIPKSENEDSKSDGVTKPSLDEDKEKISPYSKDNKDKDKEKNLPDSKENIDKGNEKSPPDTKDNKDKDKDVVIISTPEKPTKKSSVDRAIEERVARQRRLRRKFYIADGGFTDLQNLWNYEENLIKDQKEYEVWHRHHDFWLLTGIVTHGYRHWQDILNDPRFEALNRAFRNDSDKMRKGAFLNRRFQLLEQALVIEEQLRRELRENTTLLKLLPGQRKDQDDEFTQIDQLADVLRKLIKDGHIPAGTDPLLIKILMQIENLVGDIRQATYTGMPSTIAKSPAQLHGRMANIQSPNPNQFPRGTVAHQLQQQQVQRLQYTQQQKPRILPPPKSSPSVRQVLDSQKKIGDAPSSSIQFTSQGAEWSSSQRYTRTADGSRGDGAGRLGSQGSPGQDVQAKTLKNVDAPRKPLLPYMRHNLKIYEQVKAANPKHRFSELGKLIGACQINKSNHIEMNMR